MKRHGLILFALSLMILWLSCATTGPGGEKDLILISTEQEVALGKDFHQEVMKQYEVYDNQAWQDYFARIGEEIVAVSDRKDLDYTFTVINSEDINAFAVPGGYIYIFTGLLDIIENEAQLAAVTSHEISHVVARHSVKRLQQVLGFSLLYQIVIGESSSQALDAAIGLGLNVALSGYSREYEREADEYGVFYMEKAGFNPLGAKQLFLNMKEASKGEGEHSFFENMFATHPETNERIEDVTRFANEYADSVLNRDMNRDYYQQMKAQLP